MDECFWRPTDAYGDQEELSTGQLPDGWLWWPCAGHLCHRCGS